ncbi:6,7-dimethyl-8-ribityllumazine synthase [Caballeronia hypogeia]|uniref:6,7-dimethyl-8-ribityllumazine synthase n=1 Tax=Caballeronia hypogeia TaxID=1777140 RepID=A0A158CU15_9BURK|nr:6,7-dimethyl-8-ribityllumazine synthase [Caballeronia hypogeia]SAK85779.1 6,7-dimethyl-8-ribityllumazine synthase [Caballeronia hypogeia]
MNGHSGFEIAYVEAQWHSDILASGKEAFARRMQAKGMDESRIHYFTVPGAFEIPLFARRLAASGRYDAIVGAAFVVDGGIYRHDFVASTVVDALMRVQLDTNVPVFSMVLTPHHFHEHAAHLQFFKDHFPIKGGELAEACMQQLLSLQALDDYRVETLT